MVEILEEIQQRGYQGGNNHINGNGNPGGKQQQQNGNGNGNGNGYVKGNAL